MGKFEKEQTLMAAKRALQNSRFDFRSTGIVSIASAAIDSQGSMGDRKWRGQQNVYCGAPTWWYLCNTEKIADETRMRLYSQIWHCFTPPEDISSVLAKYCPAIADLSIVLNGKQAYLAMANDVASPGDTKFATKIKNLSPLNRSLTTPSAAPCAFRCSEELPSIQGTTIDLQWLSILVVREVELRCMRGETMS